MARGRNDEQAVVLGEEARPASPLTYLPGLDGLRGIAVGLVLVHHFVKPIDFGGNIGVDVFFALSGYLITTILLSEHARRSTIRLRRFYTRRAIRLWPPLLLALAVMLIPGVLAAPSAGAYLRESAIAMFYLTPAWQALGGDGAAWYHTWTLGLEEYYYLVWPALLLFVLSRRWPWRVVVGLVAGGGLVLLAAKIGLSGIGIESGAYLRAGGLLLGSALAVFMWHRRDWALPRAAAWGGLLAIAAAAVLSTVQTLGVLASISYVLASVGTCAIIPVVARGASVRLLEWAPLVAVGVVSYELYLWHYPVLAVASWATDRPVNQVSWWAGPLGILLAVAAYRLLHAQVERWKARY